MTEITGANDVKPARPVRREATGIKKNKPRLEGVV
jgi:hypothetical protein